MCVCVCVCVCVVSCTCLTIPLTVNTCNMLTGLLLNIWGVPVKRKIVDLANICVIRGVVC